MARSPLAPTLNLERGTLNHATLNRIQKPGTRNSEPGTAMKTWFLPALTGAAAVPEPISEGDRDGG